jgi:hypothetical protein
VNAASISAHLSLLSRTIMLPTDEMMGALDVPWSMERQAASVKLSLFCPYKKK